MIDEWWNQEVQITATPREINKRMFKKISELRPQLKQWADLHPVQWDELLAAFTEAALKRQ